MPLWSLAPGFQCPWCPGLEHLHAGLLLPCPRSPDSQALLLPAVCEGEVAPGWWGAPLLRFGGPPLWDVQAGAGVRVPGPTADAPSFLWPQMLLPPEAGATWTAPPAAPRFSALSCPGQRPGPQGPRARFPRSPLLGGFQPAHLYGQMCGLLWGWAGVSLSCGCPAGCGVKGTDEGAFHPADTTQPPLCLRPPCY